MKLLALLFLFIIANPEIWPARPAKLPPPQVGAAATRNPLPAAAPTAQAVVPLSSGSPAGAYYGLGNPWAVIDELDPGYCENTWSGFGWTGRLAWPTDSHNLNPRRLFRQGHPAIDINADSGAPVYAGAPGRVVWSGWSAWGFGNLVVVDHGGGWQTFYAHLVEAEHELCNAAVGQGATIGHVGQTGAATWPHLHFEVRNGLFSYDPLPLLP